MLEASGGRRTLEQVWATRCPSPGWRPQSLGDGIRTPSGQRAYTTVATSFRRDRRSSLIEQRDSIPAELRPRKTRRFGRTPSRPTRPHDGRAEICRIRPSTAFSPVGNSSCWPQRSTVTVGLQLSLVQGMKEGNTQ